jgi:hypothetical protein
MAHIIQTLAEMGSDLLLNHYSIILPTTVSQLAGVNDQLTFRITNVSIPEKTIGTYEITKRGRKFNRPSGVSEQEREISFSFRPDKKLVTYKAISNWMSYIQNNETMFMASDSGANGDGGASLFRAPIEIWAIDNLDDNNIAGTPNSICLCEGCFPTSLGGLEFDEESGEPASVDVTLNCFNIIYPAV